MTTTTPDSPQATPPLPLAAIPPPRAPTSPWTKVLIGCGIGCGVLVLAAVVASLYGLWWVASPGRQIATESVIGDDSVAVVHLAGDEAIDGLARLIGHFFSELQRQQRRHSRLPESLRWFERLQQLQQRQVATQGMEIWVPREVTLSVVEAGEDDDRLGFVVAGNFRQMVRPIRALLMTIAHNADGGPRVRSHDGHEILELDADAALCFHGGTVLLAGDVATMRATLDRIGAGGGEPPAPEAFIYGYDQLRRRWPLVGVLDNRNNTFGRPGGLLSQLCRQRGGAQSQQLEELLSRTTGLSFGATVDSADQLRGELEIAMTEAALLPLLAASLQPRLQEIATDLAEQGIELDQTLSERGSTLVTTLQLSGLAAAISRWMEQETSPRRPSPSTRM